MMYIAKAVALHFQDTHTHRLTVDIEGTNSGFVRGPNELSQSIILEEHTRA
jgi:hypothetical protein